MSRSSGSVRELTALFSALRRARRPSPGHAAQLHARLLVSGGARPHPHPVLLTQLVSLYAAAGLPAAALRAFRAHRPSANPRTYAVLVSALARPRPYLAFSLFSASRREFRRPASPHLISAALAACATGLHPFCGRQAHACAAKAVPPGDAFVYTGVVDAYAKAGDMASSRKVFDEMTARGAASWNALLVGYARSRMCVEAMSVFGELAARGRGVPLDQVSVSSVLSACTVAGALGFGRQVHACAAKLGLELSAASACMSARALGASMHASAVKAGFLGSDGVASSLITMYSKCGCLDDARRAFEGAEDHLYVMSWTAMITALQQHGRGMEAIDVFEKMLENGIPPDHITFVSVLSSCSHSGLVEQGRKYFNSMTQVHNIKPWTEHSACMVDMFGRAGLLDEAKQFIDQMGVRPDASVLGALLAACVNCRDLETGEEVAKKLFVIEPGNTENYVLLANIYASHERLEEAKEVRRWMMFQELRKEKGYSLVNSENRTCDGSLEHVTEFGEEAVVPIKQEQVQLPADWNAFHNGSEKKNERKKRVAAQTGVQVERNLGVEGTLLVSAGRREDAGDRLRPSWRSVLRSVLLGGGRLGDGVVESAGWELLSMDDDGDRTLHSAMLLLLAHTLITILTAAAAAAAAGAGSCYYCLRNIMERGRGACESNNSSNGDGRREKGGEESRRAVVYIAGGDES
ncbi:hypothetical protein U9M48_020102 [Paspalum notatum var. saurae]|uniref:Pentatricopeptide repeat-containing protein n=1 Tax=Paspalum notatum var. saurae TaxID=547442 RepID=A0AAQ3WS92_PASNO